MRLNCFIRSVLIALWSIHSNADIILVEESQYNTIILERVENQLFLKFGYGEASYIQTVKQLDDPQALPVPYTRYLTLTLAYAEEPRRIAEIGAATAQTSAYLARNLPTTNITAVELDASVLAIAKTHFGLQNAANLTLVEQDGRVFLTRSRENYDIILIDAYRGSFIPFHLTTQEFYRIAASRLSTGGVLALNIEPSTLLYEPTLVTLGSVFDHIDLYPAQDNVVAVAYNGDVRSDEKLLKNAAQLEASHPLRYPLAPMLADRQWFITPSGVSDILTDDFAPVEFLGTATRHNKRPVGGTADE